MKSTYIALALIILASSGYFIFSQNPSSEASSENSSPRSERQTAAIAGEAPRPPASGEIGNREPRQNSKNWDLRIPQDAIAYRWEILDYQAAENIFAMWLADDAEAAFDFVANAQPPIVPGHFGPAIRNYIETLEPEAAVALVAKLEGHPELQESVSANVFARWTGEDPEAAMEWLRELPDIPWRDALAHRNGRTGKFGDPEKALQWMLEEPDDEFAAQLVSGVLENWLLSDIASATEYLNRAEASPAYDQATALFVGDLLITDPSVALSWAQTIENEPLRTMIVSHIEGYLNPLN